MAEVDPFAGYAPAGSRAPQAAPQEADPFSGYTPAGKPTPQQETPTPPAKAWGFREYATEGLRALGTGLSKAATSTAGLPADALRLGQAGLDYSESIGTGKLYEAVAAKNRNVGAFGIPNEVAQGVAQGARALGSESLQSYVPIQPPETRAGKLAAEGISFAAQGAALPLGAGRAAAARLGATAGVASEGAGQVTEGKAVEPYARLAGALAGGVGAGIAQGRRAGAAANGAKAEFDKAIPEAERAVVLQKADAIMANASELGTQVSYLNALDQASGGRLNLSVLQADVEGMGRLRAFNAAIPGMNDRAASRVFDTIADVPTNPDAIGPAVGRAAEQEIGATQAAINGATRPLYRAAEQQSITPVVQRALADGDPLYAQTLAEIRRDPSLNRTVANLPDDNVAVQDLVSRRMSEAARSARTPGSATESNLRAANLDDATRSVDAAAFTATGSAAGVQGSLEQARAAQSALREKYLEPLTQGPIGKLANRDLPTKKAREILFAENPEAHSAPQIQSAVSAVSERNPIAAEQIVRAHLEYNWNRVTQKLVGGPSENGGARWAAEMAGNSAQAENLYAGLRGLRDGDVRAEGLQRFMEVLNAQGKRQGQGSNTANKLQRREQREAGGGIAGRAVDIAAGWNLPSRFKTYAKEVMDGKHLDQIAAMATDPKAIAAFRGVLRAEDPSGAVGRLLTIAKNSPSGTLQIRVQPRTEDR